MASLKLSSKTFSFIFSIPVSLDKEIAFSLHNLIPFHLVERWEPVTTIPPSFF
jgi:hypothetical protein